MREGKRRLALRRAERPEAPQRARWVDRVKNLSVVQLLEVLQPIGIIFATVAFLFDLAARNDARVVTAWTIVNGRAAGNSGKVEALEYLNSPRWFGLFGPPRASLEGIDLGSGSNEAKIFLTRVNLEKANLEGARFDRADMDSANLRGATLSEASFESVNAVGIDFRDALLDDVNFSGAVFEKSKFNTLIEPRFGRERFVLIGGAIDRGGVTADSIEAVLLGTRIEGAYLEGFVSGVGWMLVGGEKPGLKIRSAPGSFRLFACTEEPLVSADPDELKWGVAREIERMAGIMLFHACVEQIG